MSGNLNQPIIILNQDVEQTRGKEALDKNILAAKAIAETVRSTLGPRSLDKMIINPNGDIVVTNDGSTILQTIEVENPAAKMIIEVAQTMEKEVGDGTTSSTVFAAELLSKAQDLVSEKVHPASLIQGYHLAGEKAISILNELAEPIDVHEAQLQEIALTGMNSKGTEEIRKLLAEVSVKAALKVEKDGEIDVDNDIHILNAEGLKVIDTHVVDGVAIHSKRAHDDMPKKIENARIALVNDVEPKELGSKMGTLNLGPKLKFEINTAEKLQEFSEAKNKPLHDIIDKISELKVNVVMCKSGLKDNIVNEFAKRGVFAVKIASEEEVRILARATGARLIPHAERLTEDDLGFAKLVEERGKKDKETIYFEQCQNPHTITIVTASRSDTSNMGDAIVGAVHIVKDAIEDKRILPGGGATEIELSQKIREYATTLPGREHLAVNAFADALEAIPSAIAKNGGLDATDILINLRAKHKTGHKKAGIDMDEKTIIEDVTTKGIIEPAKIKIQLIKSSVETANMMLRIDDILASVRVEAPSEGIKAPGELGPEEGIY